MPTATKARTPSGDHVAGPRVQTIFARRMASILLARQVMT
jgi:hypothetical protein